MPDKIFKVPLDNTIKPGVQTESEIEADILSATGELPKNKNRIYDPVTGKLIRMEFQLPESASETAAEKINANNGVPYIVSPIPLPAGIFDLDSTAGIVWSGDGGPYVWDWVGDEYTATTLNCLARYADGSAVAGGSLGILFPPTGSGRGQGANQTDFNDRASIADPAGSYTVLRFVQVARQPLAGPSQDYKPLDENLAFNTGELVLKDVSSREIIVRPDGGQFVMPPATEPIDNTPYAHNQKYMGFWQVTCFIDADGYMYKHEEKKIIDRAVGVVTTFGPIGFEQAVANGKLGGTQVF
jgi:hypothetical protein